MIGSVELYFLISGIIFLIFGFLLFTARTNQKLSMKIFLWLIIFGLIFSFGLFAINFFDILLIGW